MHKIAPLFFTLALAISAWTVGASASAQEKAGSSIEDLRAQGYSVSSVTPVFSQLVRLPMPKGFVVAFENTSGGGNQYIWEAVLKGETTAKWSQMITLTGAKGLAANPNLTPRLLIERIAGGFKRDCPDSFFAKGIGAMKVSGHDAFSALASCGTSGKEKQSETALLFAIKGSNDYYTVQWAERGTGSLQPIPPDDSKWAERFKILNPIRLCPIVPGEAAPYPSCVNQK